MGFHVIFDIIGSAIIGGLLLLTMLNFNAQNTQVKQEYRDEVLAQENIVSVVNTMEEEIRHIGYCMDKNRMSAPVITNAGRDYITFKTDILTGASSEGDGIPDSISYRLGNLVDSTPNPRDRVFYRRENSGSVVGQNPGITYLDFKYLKYNGDTLARPVSPTQLKEIVAIELTMKVENIYPHRTFSNPDSLGIVNAYWKQLRFEIKNFGKGAI